MTGLGLRVEIKIHKWLHRTERWRPMRQHRICVMKSWTNQINWIVRKKRKGGMTDAQIAKSINVPVIRVKKLWFRYVNRTCTITYPLRMGQAVSRIAKDEYHISIHGLVQP